MLASLVLGAVTPPGEVGLHTDALGGRGTREVVHVDAVVRRAKAAGPPSPAAPPARP